MLMVLPGPSESPADIDAPPEDAREALHHDDYSVLHSPLQLDSAAFEVSPLRFIRVIRALCGQTAIVF